MGGQQLPVDAQGALRQAAAAHKPGGDPQGRDNGDEEPQRGAGLPAVDGGVLAAEVGGVQGEGGSGLVKAHLGAQGLHRGHGGLDVLAHVHVGEGALPPGQRGAEHLAVGGAFAGGDAHQPPLELVSVNHLRHRDASFTAGFSAYPG